MEQEETSEHWAEFLLNNGYCLQKCVGNGSFGDVYSVKRLLTEDVWAIKRLVTRRKIMDDKYAMAEIRALIDLQHPYIINLDEVLLGYDTACIVMEYAPEGNLEQAMSKQGGRLTNLFIRSSFLQTLSAVEYCHDRRLAHRDLNPSNILIFNEKLVKLADFGLCVCCVDLVSGSEVLCSDYLGHNAYLAPEVKKHKPFSAILADVWSLGCILYFMLVGTHPHTEIESFIEVLEGLPYSDSESSSFRQRCLSIVHSLCKRENSNRISLAGITKLSLWKT